MIDPSNPNGVDYYQSGILGGQIVKMLFDYTINN
jgi:hypothetical protein